MNITEMLLTPNKYNRPQTPLDKVLKIAWHYTANPMSTAKNNRDYFESMKTGLISNGRYLQVSSHYIIDLDGKIIQCIPETEIAYCTNQANSYSISIEVCHPDKTGKFNTATEKALIELTADICKRYGLDPMKDIIRHYDVTGKLCPLWYVNYPDDFYKAKQSVTALVTDDNQKWKIEIGKFVTQERAQIVCDFLNTCKMYADAPKPVGTEWIVVSYSYTGDKEKTRADAIAKALKEVFNIYCEVHKM